MKNCIKETYKALLNYRPIIFYDISEIIKVCVIIDCAK